MGTLALPPLGRLNVEPEELSEGAATDIREENGCDKKMRTSQGKQHWHLASHKRKSRRHFMTLESSKDKMVGAYPNF